MGLKRDAIGESAVADSAYDWRDVALYALGVGAGSEDLGYLLDSPPPKVLPTYGVIPAFEPVFDVVRKTGADLVQLLHTGMRTELLRPLPSAGAIRTRATLRGFWDMKIGALAIVDTETAVADEPCVRTSWELLLRGEGGFGGERPPARLRAKPPRDAQPIFEAEVPTRPEQALLYRLTGDVNPIHADPAVAREAGFEQPILHGLCTYGIAGRVALGRLAGDDPRRFVALEAQFSKPVVPGDTLVVHAYELGDGPVAGTRAAALTVTIKESGVQAIGNARLTYRA